MRRSALALALLCAGVSPALAQQTAGVSRAIHTVAVTVTGSSASALAAQAGRVYLSLLNQSATDTISCRFAAAAALNTAGNITLAPLGGFVWDAGVIPTDQLFCISSGTSTPLTILW